MADSKLSFLPKKKGKKPAKNGEAKENPVVSTETDDATRRPPTTNTGTLNGSHFKSTYYYGALEDTNRLG